MNIWYENLRGEYHTGAVKQLQKENDTLEHLEKKSPSQQEFQQESVIGGLLPPVRPLTAVCWVRACSRVWVLPYGTAAYSATGSRLWNKLLRLVSSTLLTPPTGENHKFFSALSAAFEPPKEKCLLSTS